MSGANKKQSMKRELTAEEANEAAALKARWLAWKAESGATQETAADFLGFKTQGAVSQYLNGRIPLNLQVASGFARLMGCQIADFSPRLAKQLQSLSPAALGLSEVDEAPQQRPGRPPAADGLGAIHTWDDNTPLDDDEVEVPLFKEVELAAGSGAAHSVEINGRKLRFSKATMRAAGVSEANAACATVSGNSMERLIMDGSTVGIDRARTQIRDGEIYAIDHDGMLRVKYLYRLPGGGLRIRSENSEEHPDELLTAEQAKTVRVLGWVFWWSTVRRWR